MPYLMGRSSPVMTACTPGSRRALEASMDRIRACGCGLRSSLQCRVRGRAMSSAKTVRPVTLASASTLGSGLPTTFSRKLHRLQDLHVTGAAAEVAAQGLLDLLPRGRRVLLQQRRRGEQDARRAVAALGRPQLRERLLQRVEV